MDKSTHFIGQPLYSQVINLLDKRKFLLLSNKPQDEDNNHLASLRLTKT